MGDNHRQNTPAPTLRANSLWMISGQGVSILFQATYFVLIGRTLGSNQYGMFVGVASLIQVLANFSSLGMEMVMVRDTSRDRSEFRRTWGASLSIAVGGFVVTLLVALSLGHFILHRDALALVPFVAVSDALFVKFVQIASRAFQGFSMLAYTAKLNAMTNAARAATAGLLMVYVNRTHVVATAYTWTKIYCLSSLVVALISLGLVAAKLGSPKFERISWRDISDGFSFSVSSSSISIYNDVDKTLLVSFGQISASGIYAAAYRIVDVASAPLYGVYAAAFPRFFQEGLKGVRNTFDFALKLLSVTALYATVAIAAMVFGARLIPFVLGPSFEGSASALRWLCVLPMIRCFHYAAGTTITGSSSQWYRTTSQIGAAVVNVVLNLLLIPLWSWRGAAVASILSDGGLAVANWLTVAWLITKEQDKKSSLAIA
jgi:O-antigen/teichoic acid export membrane protein